MQMNIKSQIINNEEEIRLLVALTFSPLFALLMLIFCIIITTYSFPERRQYVSF